MRDTSRSSCSSSASRNTRCKYLAGNREDIHLANLVSFVWLTVKFVRNMDMSLKALTATQQNLVLSEHERLRTMHFSTTTQSWDAVAGAAADAKAGRVWQALLSRRRIFLPKLPLVMCSTSSCGSSRLAQFLTSIMCTHFSTPFFLSGVILMLVIHA
jgi:hypothetical protein